jgi:toxin FitB
VPEAARRAELTKWLTVEVRPMFTQRVIEISEDIMFRWRLLVEDGRKAGHTFSQPDLLIAATALEHRLTLVTRNQKDFAGLDLSLLNPWEAQA